MVRTRHVVSLARYAALKVGFTAVPVRHGKLADVTITTCTRSSTSHTHWAFSNAEILLLVVLSAVSPYSCQIAYLHIIEACVSGREGGSHVPGAPEDCSSCCQADVISRALHDSPSQRAVGPWNEAGASQEAG